MEIINQQVTELIVLVLSGVFTLLGLYVVLFISKLKVKLQAEIKSIDDENTRTLVDNALNDLTGIVNKNIIYANETLVQEIREAAKNGVVTREELKQIATVVKQRTLSQMSEDTFVAVNKTIGDVDSYVESIIEVELLKVKQEIEKIS